MTSSGYFKIKHVHEQFYRTSTALMTTAFGHSNDGIYLIYRTVKMVQKYEVATSE